MTITACPEGDEWNHDTEACEPAPSATCQPVSADFYYCGQPREYQHMCDPPREKGIETNNFKINFFLVDVRVFPFH